MTTGLLDTSVVIDWDEPAVQRALPEEISVSAITFAELAAGPMLAAMSAHTPFGFGLFFYASHVTNYEPGGVVVEDMIGLLDGVIRQP